MIPTPDEARALWDITQEVCAIAGLPAYEISNHARPGAESRHNLVYWRYGEYAGVGPGAHGRLVTNEGRIATATEKHPETWLAKVERDGNGVIDTEVLGASEQGDEFLLMGLRLTEGVDPATFEALSGRGLDARRIAALVEHGMIVERPDGRLAVTNERLSGARRRRRRSRRIAPVARTRSPFPRVSLDRLPEERAWTDRSPTSTPSGSRRRETRCTRPSSPSPRARSPRAATRRCSGAWPRARASSGAGRPSSPRARARRRRARRPRTPSTRRASFAGGAFPGTAARMRRFAEQAPALAEAAARDLGTQADIAGITHLVVASCTGFCAPGVDQRLAERLGLDPDLERISIGYMGCSAAVNAPQDGPPHRALAAACAGARRVRRAVHAPRPGGRRSRGAARRHAVRRTARPPRWSRPSRRASRSATSRP